MSEGAIANQLIVYLCSLPKVFANIWEQRLLFHIRLSFFTLIEKKVLISLKPIYSSELLSKEAKECLTNALPMFITLDSGLPDIESLKEVVGSDVQIPVVNTQATIEILIENLYSAARNSSKINECSRLVLQKIFDNKSAENMESSVRCFSYIASMNEEYKSDLVAIFIKTIVERMKHPEFFPFFSQLVNQIDNATGIECHFRLLFLINILLYFKLTSEIEKSKDLVVLFLELCSDLGPEQNPSSNLIPTMMV
jgi:hypothetical protein